MFFVFFVFHNSFNSFLFDVTFFSLSSIFYMKLAISLSLAKFTCFSSTLKISGVNLLNS